MTARRRTCALAVVAVASAAVVTAAPASAFNPLKPLCGAAGAVSSVTGKACGVVPTGGLGGGLQSATSALGGPLPGLNPGGALQAFGFVAASAWVLGSAHFALDETADVLGQTTTPRLRSAWFSATYWRMAAIAGVLTLPFLFAAAVQALIRSDLGLLTRAAFGYLPLAMLTIAVAAPLTMLLLAASDELSRAVSSASGGADVSFLRHAGGLISGLSAAARSPFLAFLVGVFTVAGAVVLWIELLMREAAVYVMVLMLPLAFAALVWPARRVWATRAVELLVALVLSKFAIVAVLSLGGAAMAASVGTDDVTSWLAGLVLLVMGAFTPWALLRFVPLAELAAGAAGTLRHESRHLRVPAQLAGMAAFGGHDWARSAAAAMRREAERAGPPTEEIDPPVDGSDPGDRPEPADGRGTHDALPPTGATAPLRNAPGASGPAAAANGTENFAAGDGDPVAGADGAPGPGTPTSPSTSSAPASASAGGSGVAEASEPGGPGPAPAGGGPRSPATPMPQTPDAGGIDADPADDSERIAGLRSHVNLDDPMDLGLDAIRELRARARGRTPQPIDEGAEDEDATPAAQPPPDGLL